MECNIGRLKHFKLPIIRTPNDFYNALRLDDKDKQRYLNTEYRKEHDCYSTFFISKKGGGKRQISKPDSKLKNIQSALADVLFNKMRKSECCCGYVKGKSLLNNALPHLACKLMLKFDIKDFFESIKMTKIVKHLVWTGYSTEVAKLFGLLVVKNNYSLPQGSPSSPSVSNFVAMKLDYRIENFCKKTFDCYGLSYTRYADDITISSKLDLSRKDIQYIDNLIKKIIINEGFLPNEHKCRLFKNGQCLLVTGVIVNGTKPHIKKEILREINNAILFSKKFGINNHVSRVKNNHNPSTFDILSYSEHIFGLLSFYKMICPQKSEKLFLEWKKITS